MRIRVSSMDTAADARVDGVSAWLQRFRPSGEMHAVQRELASQPETRFLPAALVSQVELEELPACVLPRTLDWFDDDINPRRERWLSRREFCAALFERAERGTDAGLHALLWLRLTVRLRAVWDKHAARFDASLASVPDANHDQFAANVARSVARRCVALLDDWLDYRVRLLATQPQLLRVVDAQLRAFVDANREAKSAADARLGCAEGHYIDWCFIGVRAPGVTPEPDALRARLEALVDFRLRDDQTVPVVAWTALPQRPQPPNDALMSGKDFEKLVLEAMRGAGCCASPEQLLLSSVCVKGERVATFVVVRCQLWLTVCVCVCACVFACGRVATSSC